MAETFAIQRIKKIRVTEDIVAQIKGLIAEGKLKVGDQLPSERELSERFKVSRASVREAIRALESVGLLQARHGEGTYVARGPEALVEPLAHSISREAQAIHEVFEVRRILEPQVAALAARRATGRELEELQDILEKQARAIAEGNTGAEQDTAFHSAVARAARNSMLLRLSDTLVDSLQDSRRLYLAAPDRPRRSLAGHRAILRALVGHDAETARRAMLKHLEEIEQNILHRIGGEPVPPEGPEHHGDPLLNGPTGGK